MRSGTRLVGLVSLVVGRAGRCTFFFFNDTATTEIYTLSLHDALPISTTQVVLAHAGLTTGVGNATETVLNVRAVATPDPAAPGQRVKYAVTVSNTATATHSVLVTATAPANTTLTHSQLSLAPFLHRLRAS